MPSNRTWGDPHYVSALDEDGNETAGVRLPDVTRAVSDVHRLECEVILRAGSTLPFARTAAERQASGGVRRSLEERYSSKEDYLQRVRAAAEELVAKRFMLVEDIEPIVARAALRWDLCTNAR